MGRGARAKVVCYALCTFITVFPNTGCQSDWNSFATVETLVWLGTWEGPLGPTVGRPGEGSVKSTPLWGEDSHTDFWWTLNTNCSPVDIQGQSSYCETRIRSQSGKRFQWKWNQIMSPGFPVNSPPRLSSTPSQSNGLWQNGTEDMQRAGRREACWETCSGLGDILREHVDHIVKNVTVMLHLSTSRRQICIQTHSSELKLGPKGKKKKKILIMLSPYETITPNHGR